MSCDCFMLALPRSESTSFSDQNHINLVHLELAKMRRGRMAGGSGRDYIVNHAVLVWRAVRYLSFCLSLPG